MTKPKKQGAVEPLYSVTAAAELFHVCKMTIFRWIENGNIEAAKIGGRWYITAREIRRVTGQRNP